MSPTARLPSISGFVSRWLARRQERAAYKKEKARKDLHRWLSAGRQALDSGDMQRFLDLMVAGPERPMPEAATAEAEGRAP